MKLPTILAVTTLGGSVFLANAHATESMEHLNSVDVPVGFKVAVQASHYRYEEPDFMHLDGHRSGTSIAYTFSTKKPWFATANLRYSRGKLHYEGSGTLDNVPDTILDAQFIEGRPFYVRNWVTLSPYFGFGYRYLYNDSRGSSSTGAIGYRRYSNYLYTPVGVTSRIGIGNRWAIVPTVEYDFFLNGRQESKLSDTGLGLPDTTNGQDGGYGYRVVLMFEWGRFGAGPWFNYWSIRESNVTSLGGGLYGIEPRNWTREAGVDVTFQF